MPHPLSLDLPKDYWKGMPSLKYEGKGLPMRQGSSLLTAIIVMDLFRTRRVEKLTARNSSTEILFRSHSRNHHFESRPEMFNMHSQVPALPYATKP